MARKLTLPEHFQCKLPEGSLVRLDAELLPGETRGELMRRIIEVWLKSRGHAPYAPYVPGSMPLTEAAMAANPYFQRTLMDDAKGLAGGRKR